jgi:hypothetical protein
MNKFSLPALLLLLGLFSVAQAGELGRLFNSPQQRKQLETLESNGNSNTGEVVRRSSITVNGVVQKKGGKRTIWVNGVEQEAGPANDKYPSTASVTVPGKDRPVQLKVGERLQLDQPATEESPQPDANN